VLMYHGHCRILRASVDSSVLFHGPQDTFLAGGAKDTSTEHMTVPNSSSVKPRHSVV